MKTIEIISGDQRVLFTTRSVTLDGKEFLYAHMTNVIHSTERHIYTFTYGGEVKLLPYDEKDEKTLNAIFGQVQRMAAQKRAAADDAKGADAKSADAKGAAAPPQTPETEKADDAEAGKSEADKGAGAETSAEAAKGAESPEEKGSSEEKNVSKEKEKEKEKDASESAAFKVSSIFGKSKKSKKKKDAEAGGESADAAKAGEAPAEGKPAKEKPEEDPEKVARRKKSLKIFGLIIAILLVCSIAYYHIFGTPSSPAPTNPNVSETQQYDDIDELIDDLQ